jgi:hypothetical protein
MDYWAPKLRLVAAEHPYLFRSGRGADHFLVISCMPRTSGYRETDQPLVLALAGFLTGTV